MPSERSRHKSRIAKTKTAAPEARKASSAKPSSKSGQKPAQERASRPRPSPAAKVGPEPEPESELEPLDPKAASRAIGNHIEKKKATRVLQAPTGSETATEAQSPPQALTRAVQQKAEKPEATVQRPKAAAVAANEKPAAQSVPAAGPSKAQCVESADHSAEETLQGVRVTDRDLIEIMDQSPESLSDDWMRIQAGDNAQPAVRISKVEAEFLLIKKTAIE